MARTFLTGTEIVREESWRGIIEFLRQDGVEVDHFHGVVRITSPEAEVEEHTIHLNVDDDEPSGVYCGPQTIWKADGAEWKPSDFDELVADEWHEH